MNTKEYMDKLVKEYETENFIDADPVRFIHKLNEKKDIEIAGFIAAAFAYGSRKAFIPKLNHLYTIMNEKPYEFVMNFTKENHSLDDFNYRFSKGVDIVQILLILKELYKTESLEKLFEHGWKQHGNVKGMQQTVIDYFYSRVELPVTKGFYHLLPNPSKNSACKRLNMFLRWMIRGGCVDHGIWKFMKPSNLLIPLDVHVARVSRNLGLITRKQNDYRTVIELTEKLKEFDPQDPVKYDFAMFGYGVNN